MHLNIQGFTNNYLDLQLFLNKYQNIQVISLNEHWLSTDNIGFLNQITNFKVADFFARNHQSRGGSCLLVNKDLSYKVREDLKIMNEMFNFESSCIEIKNWNSIFISIYRIPGNEIDKVFLEKYELLLEKLEVESRVKNIFIASDFNININVSKPNTVKLLQISNMYGFQPNFTESTRVTKTTSTCIDNVVTNIKVVNLLNPKTLVQETGFSDHKALILLFDKPGKNWVNKKNLFQKSKHTK